ncbi:MAG TPA: hypothetical protein VIZ64_03990, partial [Dokdonella sp.]
MESDDLPRAGAQPGRDRAEPNAFAQPASCTDRPPGGLVRMGFAQERTLCAIAGIPIAQCTGFRRGSPTRW